MYPTAQPREELEQSLPREQAYVLEHAQQIGVVPNLIYHPRETDTCADKLSLLQARFPDQHWHLGRVVKTVFADVEDRLVGFTFPEKGLRISEGIVQRAYSQAGISGDWFKPDVKSWYIPPGMEGGTCTPFVPTSSMAFVDYLFIADYPGLDSEEVDISIGGSGEVAHRTSMFLPYGAIFEILRREFDGKVHKVSF
jgi:hypothetical protein